MGAPDEPDPGAAAVGPRGLHGAGRLRTVTVDEGDAVHAGDALATLDLDDVAREVEVAAAPEREADAALRRAAAVPSELEDRVRVLPGVAAARGFTWATLQRGDPTTPLRLAVVGLSSPDDRGERIPLVAGRAIEAAHREMIADVSLGPPVGSRVPLGDDTWTVVGVTKGFVGSGGDGLAFVTQADAAAILAWDSPEARRVEREARVARLGRSDLADRGLDDRVRDDRAPLPALPAPALHAVLVDVAPGEEVEAVRARMAGDVMELLRKVARECGSAVLVVTHDQWTLDVFDRVDEMEDGARREVEAEAHG